MTARLACLLPAQEVLLGAEARSQARAAAVQAAAPAAPVAAVLDRPIGQPVGNGILDSGESCDPLDGCPHGCPQTDSCQVPHLEGSPWTCNAECISDPITSCASGDGCCPAGCTLDNDDDCFTYYVDATDGDDAHDGRSPAAHGRSIGKVNATTLLAGESVGLKRGSLWREPLVISSSGASATLCASGPTAPAKSPSSTPPLR